MSEAMRAVVVVGGPSEEAEVSRASGAAVAGALERAGWRVTIRELDGSLPAALAGDSCDVVVPMAHGAFGEDGALQGLLEVLAMPYVGSGVLASALAMDKESAKIHFERAGLPVARGTTVRSGVASLHAAADRVLDELGSRVVLKPARGGSAISVLRFPEGAAPDELVAAFETMLPRCDVVLVEALCDGAEVTCGVLDTHRRRVFPPTLVESPHDSFYSYAARYAPARSIHHCPAPLSEALTERIRELAARAHDALGCRDLSRADFIVGAGGEVTLLEVNTLPGFTETSLYPEAAAASGLPLEALVDELARAALARGISRRRAPVPLPS